EADSLTYGIVSGPAHGTLTGAGANRTYTPAAGYSGPDSFTFKANDGSLDSNSATVSITVTHVNHNPVIGSGGIAGPALAVRGQALSYAAVLTDADVPDT